jgi:hypothetical protein
MKQLYLMPICLVLLLACKKTPDLSQLKANFLVQTSKTPEANFANYHTYFISDTIPIRTPNPDDTIWVGSDPQQLINAVKQNMSDRGYTLTTHGGNPDLGLTLYGLKDLNIGVIYPGWWWGGYWGGCYWGYCGYPPYYGYGYPLYYSITTGTLVLEMIDLKNANADGKLNVLWTSVMSGGLGFTSNDLALGVEAVHQAYTQSPYITTHQ